MLLPADGDRKVAGILRELLVGWARGEQAVVIGAGVNVDQRRDELPVDMATSLRLAGASVRREDLVVAYLTELGRIMSAVFSTPRHARSTGRCARRWARRCGSTCPRAWSPKVGPRASTTRAPLSSGSPAESRHSPRATWSTSARAGRGWHDRDMQEAGGTGGGDSGTTQPDGAAAERAPAPELFDAEVDAKDVTERLLGRPLELRRRDVTRDAGVSLLSAQKFWRALGFPVVYTDDELFTASDVDALRTVAGIVREGSVDESLALAMTRAVARSADRLAVWQAQLVAEAVETEMSLARSVEGAEAGVGAETRVVPSFETATETAHRMAELADRFEPLFVYAWRRHLSAAISRMLADADPESYGLVKMRSVGFADLVNFTSLVRKLSERDLARLVHRFERLSADVITAHGGRLIKTVGDEVLFTTVQAAPAAAIALDLIATISQDDVLPDVRCGMAGGRSSRASAMCSARPSTGHLASRPSPRPAGTPHGRRCTRHTAFARLVSNAAARVWPARGRNVVHDSAGGLQHIVVTLCG